MSIQYPEKFGIKSLDGSVNICQRYVFSVYVILRNSLAFIDCAFKSRHGMQILLA